MRSTETALFFRAIGFTDQSSITVPLQGGLALAPAHHPADNLWAGSVEY
jgi:hypothetical protein